MEYKAKHKSLDSIYFDPAFPGFGKPCDTLLKTDDGTEFKVYSQLLSRNSEFFKNLFSINEGNGQITVIHGIGPDIFEVILIYLYTGRICLNAKNVMHLLVASDFLIIHPLVQLCRKFALKNRSIENIVSLFLTAKRIKGLDMEEQCLRYFLLSFEKAIEHSPQEACDLPFESLRCLLSSRSINTSGEGAIWSFMERWVQKDPPNRMQFVPELLRCLSLSEIDDELASRLISSPVIRNNKLYEDLGDPDDTLDYLCSKCKAETVVIYRNEVPFFVTGVRQPRCVYFVTKGALRGNRVEMYFSYDGKLDVWRKSGTLSCKPYRAFRVASRLYVFRSEKKKSDLAAFAYDLLTNKSKAIASPTKQFPHPLPVFCFVVEASGSLYALMDLGSRFGVIVQRYVDETDEWIHVPPMQQLEMIDVVSLNGLIYVMCFNGANENVVQMYDPSSRVWRRVSPPALERYLYESVVYEGKIFLIGGYYNEEVDDLSRDVEVYDPAEDEWRFYPELPINYHCSSTKGAVLKGRLYVYRNWPPYEAVYWDGSGEWKFLDDKSPLQELSLYSFFKIEEGDLVGEIAKKNRETRISDWLDTGLGDEILLKSPT